jgi:hypothetical protein
VLFVLLLVEEDVASGAITAVDEEMEDGAGAEIVEVVDRMLVDDEDDEDDEP